MRSKEQLIGAEVLALVDRFHTDRGHAHQTTRKTVETAVKALALLSLAHQLAPTRSRRLALAAGAYLQHRKRKHRR